MIKTQIQMRFSDIDLFGHVNNIMIQSYYDTGKVAYYAEVLGVYPHTWREEALVLASVSASYYEEIRPDTPFYVTTRVSRIGAKSMTIKQEIIDSATQRVKSSGQTVVVVINLDTRQTVLVSEEMRAKILEHEGTLE